MPSNGQKNNYVVEMVRVVTPPHEKNRAKGKYDVKANSTAPCSPCPSNRITISYVVGRLPDHVTLPAESGPTRSKSTPFILHRLTYFSSAMIRGLFLQLKYWTDQISSLPIPGEAIYMSRQFFFCFLFCNTSIRHLPWNLNRTKKQK